MDILISPSNNLTPGHLLNICCGVSADDACPNHKVKDLPGRSLLLPRFNRIGLSIGNYETSNDHDDIPGGLDWKTPCGLTVHHHLRFPQWSEVPGKHPWLPCHFAYLTEALPVPQLEDDVGEV